LKNKESIVSADASSFGIGAVIRQKRGESLRPVAYPDMSSGLFISTIAFTLSGSTRQPDESIIWPKNLTDGFENSHFSFSVRPAFSIALNTFSRRWDTAQENTFQQIKHELASSGTLSHYDPNKESIVSDSPCMVQYGRNFSSNFDFSGHPSPQ
jgi:hypothetical protein